MRRRLPHEFVGREARESSGGAGEHVVVFLRLIGKGRHSGIEVEMSVIDVLNFRDAKVTRHRLYGDRAEALEAVGLSDQDTRADSP